MGIDSRGRLKKLVPKVPPDSSLPFEWASIPTESAREDDQQPARFVKIASNEHTVVALDEEGNRGDQGLNQPLHRIITNPVCCRTAVHPSHQTGARRREVY